MHRSARRTGAKGNTRASIAASKARAKIGSARSRSPSSRYERPSVCSMATRYGLGGLSPSHAAVRHAASPGRRHGTGSRAGRPGSPPSCCHRTAGPRRAPARPPPPSVRPWPAGRAARRSTPRARRPPGTARSDSCARTTPSSPRPCRPGRSPTRDSSHPAPAARPGRCRRRPGRGRWPAREGRWPRTTRPPQGGAGARSPVHAAAARRPADPGAGGDSGTTRPAGPARPAAGWTAPGTPVRGRPGGAEHRVAHGPHIRSSTEVRVRNDTSSSDSRDSSSDPRYSAISRSYPENRSPAVASGPPALMARAARYRPTGQPSVRSINWP